MKANQATADLTWNYRVIRHKEPDGSEYLQIHEVYYDEHGKPENVTENAVAAGGETIDALIRDLKFMLADSLHLPILDFDAIPPVKKFTRGS